MEQHQEGGVVTVSKDMEFLQQFEAVPLVELPVAIETKGETTAEGVCEAEREDQLYRVFLQPLFMILSGGSTGAIDPTKPRAVPEEG